MVRKRVVLKWFISPHGCVIGLLHNWNSQCFEDYNDVNWIILSGDSHPATCYIIFNLEMIEKAK